MSESKMKPKFQVNVLTGIVVLTREIEVTSESFFLCCEVPIIRSNSVLDEFSMNLLFGVQETMSLKAEDNFVRFDHLWIFPLLLSFQIHWLYQNLIIVIHS